ncbi:hypothetical protein HN51_044912 [Arachis hypogaea]
MKLGDRMIVQANGKGRITVHTKIGTKNIHDILFVLKLTQNLQNLCTISERKTKRLLAMVKIKNISFLLKWSYIIETALKAQKDNLWLAYRRFGHFYFHGLELLHKKNNNNN